MDPAVVLTGLVTGGLVGLTGMGGGALTTPILTLVFGFPPLVAVSTDLVANAVTKPVGAAVHLKRGTVHWGLVGWLSLGSVPCALLGATLDRALGDGAGVQNAVRMLTGGALLLACASMVLRAFLDRSRDDDLLPEARTRARPLPTVLLGMIAGLIVGTTSVGSGSLVIACLLALNPRLSTRALVGTDLAQAVPLVLAAALGHLAFGAVDGSLAVSLIIGSVPGVLIGAMVSTRHGGGMRVRVVIGTVLAGTGLTLLGLHALPAAGLALAVTAGVLAYFRYTPVGSEGRSR